MKRILAVFLAAALMMSVLCACGDTTSDASTASTDSATSADAADANEAVEATESAAPSDETTTSSEDTSVAEITVGVPNDLDSLDPYVMGMAGTREVMYNVFEGLVKISSDGSYVDAVAASHTVSDDGLTYTFTLRDDVVFHNGAAVTVDDVLYSLEKASADDSSTTSAVKSALSAATISTEGNDIIFQLEEINSNFVACLSCAYIVPADYEDQATAPVGTGPFKFVSYTVQDSLVLEKNEDYYGNMPSLDKVTFRLYTDSNSMVTALQSGALDIAVHLQYDQMTTIDNGYNVLEGTMNLAVALYLNNAVAPFDNEQVRQALCYALDVDEIMAVGSGGQGVKIGSSMFPAFSKYFDASMADAYAVDTDKAIELLTEAGYPDGFEFEIKYPSSYEHPYGDMALDIQQQLAAVGITVTVTPVEDWYTEVYCNKEFEGMMLGFDTSILTAAGMLQRWVTDASGNMINYSNPEYDETFAAACAETDDAAQTELFKQCLQILSDTAANVYIQDLAEYVIINPALDGYEFYPLYIQDMSCIYYVE